MKMNGWIWFVIVFFDFIYYGLFFFCLSEYNEYNDLIFVNDDNNYLVFNNYVGYCYFNFLLMVNYVN